jgi:hypothetical protein
LVAPDAPVLPGKPADFVLRASDPQEFRLQGSDPQQFKFMAPTTVFRRPRQ